MDVNKHRQVYIPINQQLVTQKGPNPFGATGNDFPGLVGPSHHDLNWSGEVGSDTDYLMGEGKSMNLHRKPCRVRLVSERDEVGNHQAGRELGCDLNSL